MNHLTRIKNIPNLYIGKSRFSHVRFAEKGGYFLWLIKYTELTMRKKIQDSGTHMGSAVRPGFKFN